MKCLEAKRRLEPTAGLKPNVKSRGLQPGFDTHNVADEIWGCDLRLQETDEQRCDPKMTPGEKEEKGRLQSLAVLRTGVGQGEGKRDGVAEGTACGVHGTFGGRRVDG